MIFPNLFCLHINRNVVYYIMRHHPSFHIHHTRDKSAVFAYNLLCLRLFCKMVTPHKWAGPIRISDWVHGTGWSYYCTKSKVFTTPDHDYIRMLLPDLWAATGVPTRTQCITTRDSITPRWNLNPDVDDWEAESDICDVIDCWETEPAVSHSAGSDVSGSVRLSDDALGSVRLSDDALYVITMHAEAVRKVLLLGSPTEPLYGYEVRWLRDIARGITAL